MVNNSWWCSTCRSYFPRKLLCKNIELVCTDNESGALQMEVSRRGVNICKTEDKDCAHIFLVFWVWTVVQNYQHRDCFLTFRSTCWPCLFPLEETTVVLMLDWLIWKSETLKIFIFKAFLLAWEFHTMYFGHICLLPQFLPGPPRNSVFCVLLHPIKSSLCCWYTQRLDHQVGVP